MEDNKVILLDENGEEKEFELVISFDVEDKTYVLLAEDEESDDVYPFYIGTDDDGQEVLLPVGEDEFALVEETYNQIMEEEDDECSCGCEDHHHA